MAFCLLGKCSNTELIQNPLVRVLFVCFWQLGLNGGPVLGRYSLTELLFTGIFSVHYFM